jgi:hypothetical protein
METYKPVNLFVEIKEQNSKEKKKGKKKSIKTSEIGTLENETRATFIVNKILLEKIKFIAYWDRVLIKDIVNSAFEDYIRDFERKNAKINIKNG